MARLVEPILDFGSSRDLRVVGLSPGRALCSVGESA